MPMSNRNPPTREAITTGSISLVPLPVWNMGMSTGDSSIAKGLGEALFLQIIGLHGHDSKQKQHIIYVLIFIVVLANYLVVVQDFLQIYGSASRLNRSLNER